MSFLKSFLSAVEGSIKGLINPEELYRSILTALGSGTLVGLLILIVQALLNHLGTIVPNPLIASVISMILTLILDLLRRQNQGSPVAVITPTPVVIPPAPPVPPAV